MKSAIPVCVILVSLAVAANAAVFMSKCSRIRCTACHRCEESSGICVLDASQPGCGQSLTANDVSNACSTVRCAQCRTCRINAAGQAKCVYDSGCCPTGQPDVFCYASSCQTQAAQCPNSANCVDANCGSCQAKFYDKDWNEICTDSASNGANDSDVSQTSPCAAALCPVNTKCVPEPKQCLVPPCPQFQCAPLNPCDSNPCQADEQCVFNPNIVCITTPCPQYTCKKSNASDPCSTQPCSSGYRCVTDTIILVCKGAPCPQYHCDPISPCEGVQCPTTQICQPDIKQCFTTPCPQYQCVADPCATVRCPSKCVVENGQAKCVGNDPIDPCQGVQCPSGQLCQPDVKQCFTTPCPQYQCVTNAPADPCDGVQCPTAQICQPDIKQCFTTPCPQYQCIADPCATVRCTSKCVVENGTAKCVSNDSISPCDGVQCPSGQLCRPDVKQCFTTPCPQYQCIDGDDQPINLVRCSQLPEPGTCLAAMQRWYFSRQFNRCQQFQYGGCGGNDNNFMTENDCEVTCQNLPPCPMVNVVIAEGCRMEGQTLNNETLCPMPNIVCDDNDTVSSCAAVDCITGHTCQMQDGKATCVLIVDEKTKQCSQLSDTGNCDAVMPRLYYSRTTNQCLNFTYGGCGGNSNNFNTIEECNQRCSGTPPCPMIKILIAEGCRMEGHVLNNETLCPVPNIICDDNDTISSCAAVDCITGHTCQMQDGKAMCVLIVDEKTKQCSQMPDPGICEAFMPRFYYSRTANQCLNFTFGGCGGNSNNFNTIEECNQNCSGTPPCPMFSMLSPPPGCEYNGTELNEGLCPKPKLVCNETDVCATANCQPGQICVPSAKACFTTPCPQYDCIENPCNLVDCIGKCIVVSGQAKCGNDGDDNGDDDQLAMCSQLVDSGPCNDTMTRWYYNRQYSSCKQFVYSGCEGNENRFETEEECRNNCTNVPPCPVAMPAIPPEGCEYVGMELNDAFCPMPKLVCEDEEAPECAALLCSPNSTCQVVNGRAMCVDESASDNQTIACSGLFDENSSGPITVLCIGQQQGWRYNRLSSSCEQVTLNTCGSNDNNNIFATNDECAKLCAGVQPCPQIKPARPLPGCEYQGSQLNEFLCPEPKLVCPWPTTCEGIMCTADSTCQVVNGRAQCVSIEAGDENTIACSGLIEENVCGPLPRWRYNRQTSMCENITWTGCSANSNLFNTEEECDQMCSNVTACPMIRPAPPQSGCEYNGTELNQYLCPVPKLVCTTDASCASITCSVGTVCQVVDGVAGCAPSSDVQLQTCSPLPETGPCKALLSRWYYNRQTSTCQRFFYGGCEGNVNNFASLSECQSRCQGVRPCPIIEPMAPMSGCRYLGMGLTEQMLCPTPKLVCDEKAVCAAISCSSGQKCALLSTGPKCVPSSSPNCTVNVFAGSSCSSSFQLPYYFNAISGKCEQLIVNGCQGDNLFSNIKQCERQCIEQRPCAQPSSPQPPSGCNYDISNDSEGCPTVFSLRCPNGAP